MESKSIQLTNQPFTPKGFEPANNAATTAGLLAHTNCELIHTFSDGYELYGVRELGHGTYFVPMLDGSAGYVVHYENVRFWPLDALCQVGVWRNPKFLSADPVAQLVFWNVLLPRFGAMVSDRIQTEHGMRFWTRALGRAFSKGKNVYFLKLNTEGTHGKVIEIYRVQSPLDFEKRFAAQAWGPDLKDQKIRLAITDKKIFFPGKTVISDKLGPRN